MEKTTNFKGIGCFVEKTKNKPWNFGGTACDFIRCMPYYEWTLNVDTETETTNCGSCDGTVKQTQRPGAKNYTMELTAQDCIDDIFGLGMLLGQVPKMEANSTFEHPEILDVDVAAGTATAVWINPAETLYAYVNCGVAPGPRKVVATAPAAGEVQIAAGVATLNAADLVDEDGAALTEQNICLLRIVTGTDVRYLGADADAITCTEIYAVLFGPNGEKWPIHFPIVNVLNEAGIPTLGTATATFTKSVSLEVPQGWKYPYKIWENSESWTFDA